MKGKREVQCNATFPTSESEIVSEMIEHKSDPSDLFVREITTFRGKLFGTLLALLKYGWVGLDKNSSCDWMSHPLGR